MNKAIITLLALVVLPVCAFANFTFGGHKDMTVVINNNEAQVVTTALDMFRNDYAKVFGGSVTTNAKKGKIVVGTIGLSSLAETLAGPKEVGELKQHEEAFLVTVKKGKLIVLGSEKRDTAYGMLELSRMMGVSPWEWWAD